MIEKMEESARVLSVEDIEMLESKIGVKLPDNYKSFLLEHNGGRPTPTAFPIKGLENNPFGVIQIFFGIDKPIESSNLDWNYMTFNGRIPANLFPIACDDGGDIICLSLFGEDCGAVVFWDWYDQPTEPSYSNIYHIANSFEEFIEGMRKLPEE